MKLKIWLLMVSFSMYLAPIMAVGNYATISIPKCGTHLLLKTLELISGIKNHIGPNGWCLIDQNTMNTFLNGKYLLKTHAIYHEQNVNVLKQNQNVKLFFIYRDPRDQVVSAAYWIIRCNKEWPKFIEWSNFSKICLQDLISMLISESGSAWKEVFSAKGVWDQTHSITDFYGVYLPWKNYPNVYTTTYEKLVGLKGGGSDEEQLLEVLCIAHHLEIELTFERAENIANRLFGDTGTFREGQIGSWKKHFTEEHKIAFKKVAGQLLIDLGYEKDFNW